MGLDEVDEGKLLVKCLLIFIKAHKEEVGGRNFLCGLQALTAAPLFCRSLSFGSYWVPLSIALWSTTAF